MLIRAMPRRYLRQDDSRQSDFRHDAASATTLKVRGDFYYECFADD